jgi:hypothetical protein
MRAMSFTLMCAFCYSPAVAQNSSESKPLELVPVVVEKDGGSSPRTLQSGEQQDPLKGGTHHVPEKLPEEESRALYK